MDRSTFTTGNARRAFSVAFLCSLLLLAGFAAGCGSATSAGKPASGQRPGANPNPRISDSDASVEDLANRVLAGIYANDEQMLNACRITKAEFCQHVFPELPSSTLPNVSCDFTWDQATLKSLAGFQELLKKHAGKKYHLLAISYSGGIDTYRTYKVYNKPVVRVVDENGQEQDLRLFGSILEMDGRYKLFSFVID